MTLARYRESAKESEIEAAIIEGVQHCGGYVWHVRDSRKKNVEHMPDLIVVLPPIVALIETKSQLRQITDGQAHVLSLLERCDELVCGVVRPVPREGEMSLDDVLSRLGIIGKSP